MAPRAIEVVFLGLSPRLYTLRALIISSLLIVCINIEWAVDWWKIGFRVIPVGTYLCITLYAVIAVHQIISTFKWPILYGVIELPVLIAEVIGTGYYAKLVPLQSWMAEALFVHVVLAWIVVWTLSLMICFRIADVIYSKGQSLIRPFDILAYESKSPQSNTLKKGWKSTFHMLFGRSIWKKNFVGETMSIRAIRGILAIIILSAVFFYTLLNVVFSPIKEKALSPVKMHRISGVTPTDLLDHTIIPYWTVTYALPLSTQRSFTPGVNFTSLISADLFFSSVRVTAIWPAGILEVATRLPKCHHNTSSDFVGTAFYYYFRCPPTYTDRLREQEWILPDLNINVDFGALATGLSGMYLPSTRTQLPLVIGLSGDISNDYTHTVPVTIIPGMNVAAPYIVGIRQIYTNGILATLGIYEATKAFWLPQIVALYPDLSATFTGSNLSNLNVFLQDNYGETTFIQDYREKSVIAGFSSLGGLWTAFSGIFAILFGASMLHIFYGSKPLSIFGVAHRFQAEKMKKDCLAKYPQILKENCSPENRGLLSLIRDHLINLDFVDNEEDDPSSSEGWDKEADLESEHILIAQAPSQRYSNTPW